jgi:oxygen-independent coproporphyrinogen-3 oxidase
LPVARGLSLSGEDRLRRNAIERLMCDMTVDLGKIAQAHRLAAHPLDYFATSLAQIDRLAADGLCIRNGLRVTVPPGMANYARIVASAFDQYLARGDAKHSVAV